MEVEKKFKDTKYTKNTLSLSLLLRQAALWAAAITPPKEERERE